MKLVCLALLTALPLASAPVSWLAGRRSPRGRDWFVLAVTAAELLLAAALLLLPPGELALPGVCGVSLLFQSGGLRNVLALLAAGGWLVGTLMLREYFAHSGRKDRYYAFWLLTLGTTMGVFLSGDLMTTFICFELMSFTSLVMVVHTERPEALRAGQTYLAVAVVCGLATLTGLFLLYHLTGTLRIDELYDTVQAAGESRALWAAGILTSVGFFAKAGAFPLHIWLPTAHPAAPAPASGVLSGIIIKSGVFGLLVVSTQVFRFQALWGGIVLALGLATMVVGALLAVFSVDMKRMLACSSVSQIGFILVGIAMQCLLGEEGSAAASGTLLHLVNHAAIKTILFPAAGIIYCGAHSLDLNELRGYGRGKPWLMGIMLVPMLSLAGVPGFSGYVSKTLIHEAMVEQIRHLGGSVLFTAAEWIFLAAGGLTVAYLIKLFVAIFLEMPSAGTRWPEGRYMTRTSGWTLTVCALALIPLGLLPNQLMEPVAALTIPFMSGGTLHPVDYFTAANLRGAVISLCLGMLVYLYVVRRFLMKEQPDGEMVYQDRWPKRLDLERCVYRPLLLRVLPFLGGLVARAGEGLVDGSLALMGKALYHRQTRTVEPELDPDFAAFSDEPPPRRGFRYSFAYSLLLMGLGMVFCLLYVILA